VHDILLIGNDKTFLNTIKDLLKESFSMKHFGEAAYILGIKRRKYAREAMIKWLLSYSLFMINFYLSCNNCVNWRR
jgi:NADH:ubiquinone oxidoreductase subunit B-like Fe-S oxidoreductase